MSSYNHPQTARTLSLKAITICRAAISAVHKIPHHAHFVLADRTHVLQYRTAQRYKSITNGTIDGEKAGLWLIVGANGVQKTRVVRSWARRRVLSAIVEQLRREGFDVTGRRLEEGASWGKEGYEGLRGIVDVYVQEKSVEVEYGEVLRQAGLLVKDILARCGMGKKTDKAGSLEGVKMSKSKRRA